MKAAIYRTYGGPEVVTLGDMPKPVPKDNEVLIRIHAASVSTGDWRVRSLDLPAGFGFLGRPVFGMFGPRQPILGTECSGVIEAVGGAVKRFKIGDEVIAFADAAMGCHAEYRALAEDKLIARKPANVGFEDAACLCFGGTTALSFLRDKAKIKAGDKVLIVGASGGVGTAAVQLAKHFGAEVTGVTSNANVELVRALGADKVIDYSHEDFAKSGETYDIILDTTGTATLARSEATLKPGGRLLAVLSTFAQAVGLGQPSKASGKKVIAGVAKASIADIELLAALAADGTLKPVIDRSYPLANAAEAHAYVDTGHKRGNVVLTMR